VWDQTCAPRPARPAILDTLVSVAQSRRPATRPDRPLRCCAETLSQDKLCSTLPCAPHLVFLLATICEQLASYGLLVSDEYRAHGPPDRIEKKRCTDLGSLLYLRLMMNFEPYLLPLLARVCCRWRIGFSLPSDRAGRQRARRARGQPAGRGQLD